MKCEACKYESWEFDNKFIEVNIVATIQKKGIDNYPFNENVDILACPKCGTLIIHTDDLPYFKDSEEE